MEDIYRNPSPLQFDGPCADAKVVRLCVEDQYYMCCIKHLQEFLDKTDDLQDPIIICGFGRVGQIIAQLLSERLIPFVALDVRRFDLWNRQRWCHLRWVIEKEFSFGEDCGSLGQTC